MTVKKKSILLIGALALVLCLGILLFSCRGPAEEPQQTESPVSTTYTIELTTGSGMALEGVGIYIYTDDSLTELVWFAKTDDKGVVTFTDKLSDSYVAVLTGVPEGYPVEEMYPITGETTRIVLGNEMLEVDDLAGLSFDLGDMICDFTVTAVDGTEYTISQLLQEKNAVVLNFWYLECAPCRAEFPYLQEAYEKYSDTIEVLAMNPVNTEPADVVAFQKENELTFPMALCDAQWQQAMQLSAYPTTVVIDRFGNITLIHEGSVTEAALFERIFAYYGAEDYVQTVAESVEDLPETEEEREARTIGTKDNPIAFGGFTSYTVTVDSGEEVYLNVYKVTQMYLQISDPDAYVIYKDKTYKPSNGTVGLTITSEDVSTPVQLIVGNSGKDEKDMTLRFSLFKGTMGNPYTMTLGQFTASVAAGNEQGVYYTYKATEAGVLTVKCVGATAGIDYDFTLYNLNTYALRNYQSEGAKNESGERTVSIKVRAGDTVQFSAAAMPDSSGVYPAASFTFEAYMGEAQDEDTEDKVEKILYAVTLTDENRAPIAGAQVYVTQADGSLLTLTTDEKGIAHSELKKGTYPVTVKIPAGYKARVTEFTLTESDPIISVKLETDVVVTATYTVKVVDEAGQPVSKVLVSVGGSFGYTNESGSISFTLEQAEYTAVIGTPEGYTLESSSIPFGGNTELTVTLKKGVEEDTDDGKLEYTVQVTDYYGAPMTNATVTFLHEGVSAGIQKVDANGTAVMSLDKGSYTVSLAFDSGSYYCDTADVLLTEENASAVIVAVAKQSGKYEESYVGELYYVPVGATYAELQSGVTNYFLFEPEKAGTYRFTTSDPEAVISYWGANMNFIVDMTASTDLADNAFNLNIKEGYIGNQSYIIGVTGSDSCVLVITRTGDPILDESDIVPDVYEAKTVPTAFTIPAAQGKKLTNVDITGVTADFTPVLGSDGYYHLNSANGPILYVNLGPKAPYVSFYQMLGFTGFGGTSFSKTFYDDSGKALRKEDYTACMCQYVESIDPTYGVYPMTEDLYYMLQNGGEHKGWWDSESANYLFADVKNVNTEIAWMFACCYVK